MTFASDMAGTRCSSHSRGTGGHSEDLRQQLELARDIEDWDKVEALSWRLWEREAWGAAASGANYDNNDDAAHHRHFSARSRSPRGNHGASGSVSERHCGAFPVRDVAKEYNKVIKRHLRQDSIRLAKAQLFAMQASGVSPTVVTYNEFLNFCAQHSDTEAMFRWVSDMRLAGLSPNRVSASTVLKAICDKTPRDHLSEIERLLREVMKNEGVDEILVSSMAEAAFRVGTRTPWMFPMLREMVGLLDTRSALTAKTCGSLIRAHGQAGDTASMCDVWNSMLDKGTRPTPVTTGCMVEQLVLNNRTDEAQQVIDQLKSSHFDECINAVVYSSLLKGFGRDKCAKQISEVYAEMKRRGLSLNVTTYNALVGAFSECGLPDKATEIFTEMKESGITPTVCTWTRLSKAFSLKGDLKGAADVMEQMRSTTGLKPDEIFYHSLLDGCAESGAADEGLRILERMQRDGLKPSKFTLSILTKLMLRAGRVADAFGLVEEVASRHLLAVGTNVFASLVLACSKREERLRAIQLLREMIRTGESPDRRPVNTLLKCCLMPAVSSASPVADSAAKPGVDSRPAAALETSVMDAAAEADLAITDARQLLEAIGKTASIRRFVDKQCLHEPLEAWRRHPCSGGATASRRIARALSDFSGGWLQMPCDVDARADTAEISFGDADQEAKAFGARDTGGEIVAADLSPASCADQLERSGAATISRSPCET
eukprot:TRINITY_DN17735_c0_g1_i1.p1 TRINITY_DN17735_c0_g1~~TRINITY_DN17735_c0_g1_i1.p1  ORF type:complete len:715 (-),score=127.34 TRINITY_DN17735_c0_g1_i1:12-2156(-)